MLQATAGVEALGAREEGHEQATGASPWEKKENELTWIC